MTAPTTTETVLRTRKAMAIAKSLRHLGCSIEELDADLDAQHQVLEHAGIALASQVTWDMAIAMFVSERDGVGSELAPVLQLVRGGKDFSPRDKVRPTERAPEHIRTYGEGLVVETDVHLAGAHPSLSLVVSFALLDEVSNRIYMERWFLAPGEIEAL